MHFFAFVFAAVSVTSTNGLESDAILVSESTNAKPGFTWCYDPSMRGRCITATTLPDQCLNVSLADNDKASSATAHPNSYCTMYNRYNCGTNGETLEILPQATIDRFSDYNFDNKMGSYRCKWVIKPPTEVACNILVRHTNGTDYGYLSPGFNADGFYGSFQASQADALAVSFSYSATTLSRINLRALNGPAAASDSKFPFVGGIVWGNENLGLYPGDYAYIPLGGTCETPPLDHPRMFSTKNSFSAATNYGPTYLQSPIWRYDPIFQALTAQWINPDRSETQTKIVLAHEVQFQTCGGC
ncbi:hypothetical protein DFH09DRAFT_287050 [Mycena vulgaris]|nr:hypothetical protein DFH09DRAFT_287050 [Mycena vulgaris]